MAGKIQKHYMQGLLYPTDPKIVQNRSISGVFRDDRHFISGNIQDGGQKFEQHHIQNLLQIALSQMVFEKIDIFYFRKIQDGRHFQKI